MSRHKAISNFSEFITEGAISQEGKFFDNVGTYVYTDFKKRGSEEKVQKYRNVKTGIALNLLEIVWKSGKEGMRYSDLSRAYFEMGADRDGKKERHDYDRESREWKSDHRKYNPTHDRGYGASFLVRDSWQGQTGILVAHCSKNDQGRWILTDPILNELFAAKWAQEEAGWEQSDIDMLDELGILGKTAAQYREDK